MCVCVQENLSEFSRKESVLCNLPAFLCAQQWYVSTNDENKKQTSGASVVKQGRSLKIHKNEKSAALA